MIVVGDQETNGNDLIAGTCPYTYGVFLGLMTLLNLEDRSKIGVQL